MTQGEIADILQVTRSSYAMWESNNELFPIKRLIDFCELFSVSVDYIFNLCLENNYRLQKYNKDKSMLRLKEFRKENKLTQVKLATFLNTVHPVITNYEKGKHLISTPFLYQICQKYHISADYLLGKTVEPKYL